MDFFEDVSKKVSEAANFTVKKTEKLTEVAKLKYNLMREKSKLEDAYKNMGELYYNQMKNGEVDEQRISLAYDKIEKSVVEIDNINAQISMLNNTRICACCGEKLDKEMAFCHKCGAKVEKDEADADKAEEETEAN